MLFIIPIIIALVAGCYLLALVSDAFAYELSRVVEGAFDFIEYKSALRQSRRRADNNGSNNRALGADDLRGVVRIW